MKTKLEYYKRTNPIIHGSDIKHYPSGTSILVDILITSIHEQCNKFQKKKVTKQ